MKKIIVVLTLCCFVSAIMTAQTTTIFSHLQSVTNQVIIDTQLDSLLKYKKEDFSQEALLSYIDENGIVKSFNIKISPRGKSRRRICDFPPLKLKFSKTSVAEKGLRTKHKSLKLVTHCHELADSEQNVFKEYLTYKLYQLWNPNSYKTHLIKVLYRDTDSQNTIEKYAVLIEDTDEMIERIGGEELEVMGVTMDGLDQIAANKMAVFQYMIGNADWRVEFLRNIKIVETENAKIPVPYDFDFAGLVGTEYARPDEDFGLTSVRQRYFRGNFRTIEERNQIVADLKGKKIEFIRLIDDMKLLESEERRDMLTYMAGFFELIEQPDMLNLAMPINGNQPVVSDDAGYMRIEGFR